MALKGRRLSYGLWALAALALLLGWIATPASAQFGLAEQAATNAAAQDLQNGRNSAVADATPDDAKEAIAEENSAEADAAPAPAAKKAIDEWNDEHSIFRQKDLSVSWWKVLLIVLLVLLWVRSCDWVNRDAQIFNLGHELWNSVMVFPFALICLLAMFIPAPIGLSLLLVSWIGPFIAYVMKHNKSVEAHQTVFTGSWWRFQIGEFGKLFGLKLGGEKKADYLRGPDVDLQARGGDDDRDNQANLLTARQSPGYVHVKELIADLVARGASRALLDYGAEAVTLRYMIDGVWHAGEPRDRESGDVMLAVMKQLADLDTAERKKKQQGEFGAAYEKKKYDCIVESQGVKTGERVVVSLRGDSLAAGFKTLEQLGMREKLRDQWFEILGSDTGIIVYSALPEGGLTTLTDVGMLETDRLMRDFVSVEDVSHPETDIENIASHYYDAAKGESPSSLIPSLSRKYPSVWVVRDFVDAETAKLLMDEVDLDRLVITTVQAGDVAEACLRLLKQKTPHKEFARGVIGVINTRLIRKLCTACRVEYEASPNLLKKLGIPPGKVSKLYRPPNEEEINKPCVACSGLGYKGRTGLFELLVVDDQFREKLLKEPKMDVLRKAARAAGMRTLQEEGVLLVAKGTTSLQELQRVLKG
ncbi:Type II secretion system protein E [Planctomycetes bacterium MalM25]|nr:Type II secretion system protein E [Planctomycetes bacterium MalM25]